MNFSLAGGVGQLGELDRLVAARTAADSGAQRNAREGELHERARRLDHLRPQNEASQRRREVQARRGTQGSFARTAEFDQRPRQTRSLRDYFNHAHFWPRTDSSRGTPSRLTRPGIISLRSYSSFLTLVGLFSKLLF